MEQNWMHQEVSTGTTILAFKYEDGVMIAADSRTSSGNYVANRFTDKLTKITDYVYCCRSGSAADTQAIADIVSYNINLYENQHDKHADVHDVAREFRHICYEYRKQLLAGVIIAGFDKAEANKYERIPEDEKTDEDKNKQFGKVFSVALGGMCWEEDVAIGGSGSSYVQAYIESKYQPNMNLAQSLEFACSVVGSAMTFDGSSGGVIRIGTLTKRGMKRFTLQQTLKPDANKSYKSSIEMIY